MFVLQVIEITGSTIWAALEAFLSLLPIINQINGLHDQIIAVAIGVPAGLISIGGTLFTICKFVWGRFENAR